jgi:DNA-binding NtrC family response regulator
MARILLVDDEGSMLKVLSSLLQVVGHHEVLSTQDGVEASQLIKTQEFDLMITDVRMSPMNGMQLLKLAHDSCPNMVVILVTAFTSIETALEAHDLGAFDYVPKPFKIDELLETVTMAMKYKEERTERSGADIQIKVEYCMDKIVGKSPSIRAVCSMIERIAPADMPVLLSGLKGVGKSLIAETIHNRSSRKGKKFTSVNCRELSKTALETELFRSDGALESASRGSILLEEVDSMSSATQAKLLAVMKEKKLKKAGSGEEIPVNVRILASTAKDLGELTRKGLFMPDLYRMISGIHLEIPPLRDRPEDILPLTCEFINAATHAGSIPPKLAPEVCAMFTSYSWPGNADELKAMIKGVLPSLKDKENVIKADFLSDEIRVAVKNVRSTAATFKNDSFKGKNLMKFVRKKRKEQLQKVVEESGGDRRKAAMALNISVADLSRELDES